MLKRNLLLILATLLLLPLSLTHAQTGSWTAWLYTAVEGRMTQVDDTGAVLADVILPLPTGFDRYPQKVAVGHGGSPFAYVAFNSTTFQGALVVTQGASLLASFNLPLTFADSTEFVADESIFNENNSALAMGYSLDGGGWGLLVFDLLSGTVAQTIRHDTPTVSVLGLSSNFGLTPVPRRFIGREVIFSMIQAGSDGASEYAAYTWNIDSDAITNNLVYPSLDADIFQPTGEIVMSLPDDRLPNQSDTFTFFQANSLHVFDPFTGARFPFYNAPDLFLYAPHFIQNGELVLVNSTTADGGSNQWTVIGRDGVIVGALPATITINDVAGLGDGFLYTTDAFTPGATTLVYVNTRDGLNAGVPIWQSAAGALPVIAWAGDTVVRAQAAYAPWTKLADAVYAPGVTAQVAPVAGQSLLTPAAGQPLLTPAGGMSPSDLSAPATPVFGRFLTIGSLATINTTEGDELNVRQAPNTTAAILGKLPDGSRVTITDGPRSADGFNWWKVRTGSGIEGWVVESVDDGGTRLQTLLPE
jgi:hypothetical protein